MAFQPVSSSQNGPMPAVPAKKDENPTSMVDLSVLLTGLQVDQEMSTPVQGRASPTSDLSDPRLKQQVESCNRIFKTLHLTPITHRASQRTLDLTPAVEETVTPVARKPKVVFHTTPMPIQRQLQGDGMRQEGESLSVKGQDVDPMIRGKLQEIDKILTHFLNTEVSKLQDLDKEAREQINDWIAFFTAHASEGGKEESQYYQSMVVKIRQHLAQPEMKGYFPQN